MTADPAPVVAACARWLLTAFPPPPGAFSRATAEAQAWQAATVAAALRHPTGLDAELLHLLGPGGSDRLDELTGHHPGDADTGWRTWVDETVVSWAACLLADGALAARAHRALATTEHAGVAGDPRRLTLPTQRDTDAAPLLRHPDLVDPVAALHRPALLALLATEATPLPLTRTHRGPTRPPHPAPPPEPGDPAGGPQQVGLLGELPILGGHAAHRSG
ncbi:hypothetical protein [Streptomyces sp. NRRL B-24484]|uniref:hypothetical protein n=1 Tax=Streptomyces sp. NRRL B-24484 TaxID=1463833 RepID=UPI0007C5CBEF|nr:hypothetical protein [Streptomyces sp. NRRL B-24484]